MPERDAKKNCGQKAKKTDTEDKEPYAGLFTKGTSPRIAQPPF